MPLYAVTYDLNKKKDYPKLWAEFERLGGHKAAESFYFLDVNSKTAVDLRNHLTTFVDADDTLIVVPMPQRPAPRQAKHGTKAWLDKKYGPA